MLAWIQAFLLGLVQAVPILAKYFPPKATETTVEQGAAAIDKKLDDEMSTGRPQ